VVGTTSYELKGVRVAFVVANEGSEEVALVRPGTVETMRHLDKVGRFPVDQATGGRSPPRPWPSDPAHRVRL